MIFRERCAPVDPEYHDKRTAQRVKPKLIAKGLIQVKKGGGRKHSNLYKVITNPGTMDATLFDGSNPGTDGATVSGESRSTIHEKPRQSKQERVANRPLKGGTQVPPVQIEQTDR